MNTPSIFVLLALLTLTTFAQSKKETPTYNITAGIGIVDDFNSNNFSPFSFNNIKYKLQPFLSAEYQFKKNWSANLDLSSNEIFLSEKENYSSGSFYVNYLFNDFIFKKKKVTLYTGLGTGFQSVDRNLQQSLNVTAGIRYWLSDGFGITLKGTGKLSNKGIEQLGTHFQYNMGVTYTISKKTAKNISTPKKTTKQLIEQDTLIKTPVIKTTPTTKSSLLLKQEHVSINDIENLKGFHVVIYYNYKIDTKFINLIKVITKVPLKIFKDPNGSFTYISIKQFKTREEANNYIDYSLDQTLFDYIGVFEVEN